MQRTIEHNVYLPDGLEISVRTDRTETADAMAIDIASVLFHTPSGQTILLATGVTMLDFYPRFITRAKENDVDLSSFSYGHLDNYVWRPSLYPNGPNKEDFIEYLKKNFLEPAHIPDNHFYPINGTTENPRRVAQEYNDWLSDQKIAAVFLGLGPAPEVHLAYIKEGTSPDRGVHHVLLSDVTVARNIRRGEKVPTEAITVGIANIKQATHKFVLAFDKTEEVRLTFTGPITPDVVATALRTDGFNKSVHVYLDEVSARGLTDSR